MQVVADEADSLSYEKDDEFEFIIPGRLCPNNLVIRHFRGRSVKNPRAVEDQNRVAELAINAASRKIWHVAGEGEAIELHIMCWNPLGNSDIDGRQKVIMDGLKDIAYDDDRRVKRLLVEDFYDWDEPRYVVRVRHIPLQTRQAKPRKMRFSDLGQQELLTIVNNPRLLLDPNPTTVLPAYGYELPKSWITRAKKIFSKGLST